MSNILIVGCGEFQRPLISMAQGWGHKVIGIDGDSSAPGALEVDIFENVDLSAKEQALGVASEHKVKAVITAGTDFSTTVAYIANALNLPGIPYKTAYKMSHKFMMREALRKVHIPQPQPFAFVSSVDYLETACLKVGFPDRKSVV